MLVVQDFVDQLRRFADPTHPSFAPPVDEDDARSKWANAFLVYVTAISPQPPAAITGVELAFYTTLRFAPTLGAIPAVSDLAAAWASAMTSMLVVVPPPAPRGTWDNLPGQTDNLRATLSALFAAPSLLAVDRLTAIANAFHIAITGGLAPPGVTSTIGTVTTSYS